LYLPRVYVDLDGVVADFDKGYEALFGHKPDKENEPKDFWKIIDAKGDFFLKLDPMTDAYELMDYLRPANPTFLTGAPMTVPTAAYQKMVWGSRKWPDVPLICCQSKKKFMHGRKNDILIDDWTKYKHLWEEMGGMFVHHITAAKTIQFFEETKLLKNFMTT
jgi:5'(3')-deoxyribonucleotidase